MLRYFQCEQNVLTNSMRTYTITALRVDQWEILAKEFILDVTLATNMRLTFKMTCCTFLFLQILLAERQYVDFSLNADKIVFKLLQIALKLLNHLCF